MGENTGSLLRPRSSPFALYSEFRYGRITGTADDILMSLLAEAQFR